ncbi:MAG: restriction endonuclease subunit S, partial [Synergistaceae bacterium]|nr:restriction endonuclease subunit S [Synergistaceae bacterium]
MKLSGDLRRSVLQAAIQGELTGGSQENWRWVRLGDISLSIQYGYNAPACEKGSVKMVRITDIQNNNIQWDKVPYCEISEDEMQKYLLAKNDILFARTGGTVGKSYLVGNVQEKAIYAGYLIRMKLNDEVNPQYVKYFMESESYWKQLRNGTTATAQPNCNGKTLSQMIIPLPPLEEQHRIVSRLDAILPLIDELEALENELEALKKKFPGDMRDSLLQAAIQGELTGGSQEGWRWVRLGDIISLRSGHDLPKGYDTDEDNGTPYITGASNFKDGAIIINRWTSKPESVAHKGDVLLTCKGTVGKVAILKLEKAH